MKHGGITTADSYERYLMKDGKCHNATVVIAIASVVYTKPGNVTELQMALLEQPVAINIDAAHASFDFYSSGVYYELECSKKPHDINHTVLAVGFGTLDGEDYWIIENSCPVTGATQATC